ncbi:MAG: hypothetical protein ACPHI0_02480 [Paracoccaceae bacterium]
MTDIDSMPFYRAKPTTEHPDKATLRTLCVQSQPIPALLSGNVIGIFGHHKLDRFLAP